MLLAGIVCDCRHTPGLSAGITPATSISGTGLGKSPDRTVGRSAGGTPHRMHAPATLRSFSAVVMCLDNHHARHDPAQSDP